jgi:hypothetical protein
MEVREYILRTPGQADIVTCKLCPEVIMVGPNPTPGYNELVIGMLEPDGQVSLHETGCCTDCRDRVLHREPLSAFELEALWACDLLQWRADALRARQPEGDVERLIAVQRARKPLRVMDREGRGVVAG